MFFEKKREIRKPEGAVVHRFKGGARLREFGGWSSGHSRGLGEWRHCQDLFILKNSKIFKNIQNQNGFKIFKNIQKQNLGRMAAMCASPRLSRRRQSTQRPRELRAPAALRHCLGIRCAQNWVSMIGRPSRFRGSGWKPLLMGTSRQRLARRAQRR